MKIRDYFNVLITIALGLCPCLGASATEKAQITSLYDAFGKSSELQKDWGFAAYIEYGGKRILFDTGNNAEVFAHNVKAKGIDLKKLDFVIVSHRHSDHATGLNYLMKVNPKVAVYVPKENFSVFGAALPGAFIKPNDTLPTEFRYFDGKVPDKLTFGSAWPQGNFKWVAENMEIAPGFQLILLKGEWGVDLPVMEISLAIDTPDGTILVVGCSHPTIEKVVQATAEVTKRPIHLVVGGLHLLPAKDDEIHRIAAALRDDWKVDYVAPLHCTGEAAFGIFKGTFGERYIYAGLGTTIKFGSTVMAVDENGRPTTYAMDRAEIRTVHELMVKSDDFPARMYAQRTQLSSAAR
jgi:7,8-dihydropterin-6-yl-methyl-4-(beta-D-ribofuranosyl)aminobenzene 5'-phosphate synthase